MKTRAKKAEKQVEDRPGLLWLFMAGNNYESADEFSLHQTKDSALANAPNVDWKASDLKGDDSFEADAGAWRWLCVKPLEAKP